MNDLITVALIAATPPTIVAIGGFVLSWLNRKKLSKMETHVLEFKIELNGKMAQLLKVSGESERAKGVEEGRVLGAHERQDRVTESERVEDRQEQKTKALDEAAK